MKFRYLFIAYFVFIFCQIVFFGPYVAAVIGTIIFIPFTIFMLVALLIIQYGLFFIGRRMKMILMFIFGFAVDYLMLFVILSGMAGADSNAPTLDMEFIILGGIWSTGGGIAGLLFYRGLFYEKDKLRQDF